MKKYLNKALFYQWFNSAKLAIILGLLLWGFCANEILGNLYSNVMNNVANLSNNNFITAGLEDYFILGIIFLGIYFIVAGTNKRNTTMFLSSGPYTKKQIKYNELICFMITLGLFVLTYIYIAVTFYIRNREKFVIINGYSTVITIEIIKVIIFGIIGIVFMLIVDSMFSNNTIGVIFMIIIPISFIASILQRIDFYRYLWINNVIQKEYTLEELNNSKFSALTRGWLSVREFRMKNVMIGVLILLIFIVILLAMLNISQRKNSLETNIKFFASKWSEKVLTIYLSVASGIIISDIVLDNYQQDLIWRAGERTKLPIKDFGLSLGYDVICATVFGAIIYIIIKKILKKFS